MDEVDRALGRAWEIFIGDLSDETDTELEDVLLPLVAAGYVAIDEESPTGFLWRFTPEGIQRAEALGLD
jgi:hypothetical protein